MTLTAVNPAGLHDPRWICEQAGHENCFCGAQPDEPCDCAPGGMHLARYYRASTAGHISERDEAYFTPDGDNFTGMTVVPNPGAAA